VEEKKNSRNTLLKRTIFGNRMVLQKISCDFVKRFRHVHARTSEPCGKKSFQRLYTALPRLTPQEVYLNRSISFFSHMHVFYLFCYRSQMFYKLMNILKNFLVQAP